MRHLKRLINALLLIALINIAPGVQQSFIYHGLGDAVSKVEIMDSSGKTLGTATGFNLKYKGSYYFVTNKHVCADDSFTNYPYLLSRFGKLNVLHVDKYNDLCISTGFSDERALRVSILPPFPGALVTLIGHPDGQDRVVTRGQYISDELLAPLPWLMYPSFPRRAYRMAIEAFPGSSGSPMLDSFGFVVGVHFAGNREEPNGKYAVPYEVLVRVLDQIHGQ